MSLPTQEKIDAVEEIKERLQNNACVVMASYIGMDAAEATDLRSQMRSKNVAFKVYKNTLGLRALKELGFDDASAYLDGPTVWAFSEEDPVAPSKVLKDFHKEVEVVDIRGGILDGKVVSKADLDAIADLPSQEQLIAQVVGVLAAPLQNFLGVMNAVPRDFVGVVDQIKKQKEEQESAA
jgi:large subunit ribosomal protein L10